MDYFCVVLQLSLLLHICKRGECYGIRCYGELTVDQEIIAMGSNLTVHCRSNTSHCGRFFVIKVDKKEILRETNCSMVTAQFMVSRPRMLLLCKVQQNGKFHIVCGRDIEVELIPRTPFIEEIEFANGTLSPSIQWQVSEKMELLKPDLRFRKARGASDWMKGNVTQLHRGKLLMLEDLEPRTSYEFELRVCTATLTNCSLWSQSVHQTSPGKAPLGKLDVWRIIRKNEENYTQNVTVMWKAFTTDDHEGELQGYELIYQQEDSTHTLSFSEAVTQHSLQLPLEVTRLNVRAVTSAGSSPPAAVSLTYTGRPAPILYFSKAAGGRILLDWNTSHTSYVNTTEEMLGFVVQWQCSPLTVQWRRIRRDQNSTLIDGSPCSLYNISLYVESSEGVSDPTSGQIHFKEEISEVNGPSEAILPKMMSKSRLTSTRLKDGLVIGIILMTAVPLVIMANLMYLKCARQRIRKMCMSMGPSWLFEQLPKLGDSNAIKLLKDETCGSNPCWQQVDFDPPLSPVEDFSPPEERKSSYPTTHTESTSEETTAVQDWAVCPYKPQLEFIPQRLVAVSEAVDKEEDEHPWVFSSPAFTKFDEVFFPSQGMHGPLNSSVTVDGAPISVDVNKFIFLSQTSLE